MNECPHENDMGIIYKPSSGIPFAIIRLDDEYPYECFCLKGWAPPYGALQYLGQEDA